MDGALASAFDGNFSTGTTTYTQVPEPGKALLVATALVAFACLRALRRLGARLRLRPTSG